MTKYIGWGLAGLAAIVAAILVARSSKADEPKGYCLADMPEPFKSDVAKIIKTGDVARMNSFAAQSDAKGWHCAAKELRVMAKKLICDAGRKAGEAAGVRDLGDVSRPNKQTVWYSDDKAEQKEFDRCFYDGYESKWKHVAAAGCPDDAMIISITAKIATGGMSVAEAETLDADYRARFMIGMPDYAKCGPLPVAWEKIRMAIAEKKGPVSEPGEETPFKSAECRTFIDALPKELPFHVGSSDTYQPRDLRAWVHERVDIGTADIIKYTATFLIVIADKFDWDRMSGGQVYRDAATCLNTLAASKA